MAYWQNGKCYMHVSTQSTARTEGGTARALGIEPTDLVLISEYCGGGFGSKIAGCPQDQISGLLSRKVGKPVMLRVTRQEENYFGKARPGIQTRAKFGFRSDGRVVAHRPDDGAGRRPLRALGRLHVLRRPGVAHVSARAHARPRPDRLHQHAAARRTARTRAACRRSRCSRRSSTRRRSSSGSTGWRSSGSTLPRGRRCSAARARACRATFRAPSSRRRSTRPATSSTGPACKRAASSATAPR